MANGSPVSRRSTTTISASGTIELTTGAGHSRRSWASRHATSAAVSPRSAAISAARYDEPAGEALPDRRPQIHVQALVVHAIERPVHRRETGQRRLACAAGRGVGVYLRGVR